MQVIKCVLQKWFFYTIILLFAVIMSLKGFSLKVFASDNIVNYYGERPDHYEGWYWNNYYGYWQSGDPALTVGCILKYRGLNLASNWGEDQYLIGYKPYNDVFNNGSVITSYVYMRFSTTLDMSLNTNTSYPYFSWNEYNSVESGTWHDIINVDGIDYVYFIRQMKTIFNDGNTFIVTYPRSYPAYELENYNNIQILGNNELVGNVIRWYEKGIKAYESGVNIENVNASIDTSNIESLIQDNNTNVATITQDVGEIKNSGIGGSGLTDEDRDLFKHMDLFIVLIFFSSGLLLFRQVIHQLGRNVRGVL